MTLTLRAVSLNDQPLSQPITASFDARGGTIGRADHNTMALPDPERHISRLQAEIIVNGPSYLIKNVGAANPVIVNGQPLAHGESATLRHKAQLRIGGYLLQVIDDVGADTSGAEITRGRAALSGGGPADALRPNTLSQPRSGPLSPAAGLGDLSTPLSSSNPFADLLGAPPAAAAKPRPGTAAPTSDPFGDLLPPPAGIAGGSRAMPPSAPLPASAVARLPDDFDPFASPPAPAPAAPVRADAFGDLHGGVAPASIDQMFDLPGAGGRTPLDDFLGAAPVAPPAPAIGAPAPGGLSTDPLALFGGPVEPAVDAGPAQSDHASALKMPFSPPQALAPVPPTVAAPATLSAATAREIDWLLDTAASFAMPAPTNRLPPLAPAPHAVATAVTPTPAEPAVGSADSAALWAAFCAGAGVDVALPQGLTPEMMRSLGQMLQAAVEGTLQLMAIRATTKQEMRGNVTVIQQRANNPLKFSPDAATGLEQLLRPPMRGFMAGPVAMADAMTDLVGHSIGSVAGMRAALESLLARFEPAELEARLAGKSVLDSVLPMNRKAKLWDLYRQHFDAIRDDAQEDFHAVFGKAFLAAYEQQLDRLRQGRG